VALSARGKSIRGKEPGTSCRGKDVEHDHHDSEYSGEISEVKEPTDFGIAADSGTGALQVWRYIFRPRVDYRMLISPAPIETSPLPRRSRVEEKVAARHL
jgi:hypothetical protein